jgi:vacuolar iron transporter family protein
VFWAALFGSLIPLSPYFFVIGATAVYISLSLSALVLFIVGFYKSRITRVGNSVLSGLEMTIIGLTAAGVGWLIGWGFNYLFNILPFFDK